MRLNKKVTKLYQTIWDEQVPGLGLRQNKYARMWVLKYRFQGRQVLTTLGEDSEFSLPEARVLAKQMKRQAKKGINPQPNKASVANPSAISFEKFSISYMEHAQKHKKSWKKDQQYLRLYILPRIGSMQLKDISRRDIADLHADVGMKAPYQANRSRQLLSHMFKLAHEWGHLPSLPSNPAHGIKDFREVSRDRWVTPAEMPRLAEAINKLRNQYARAALWLILLTGMRKSEVLKLRWSYVDFDRSEIALPDTKAGRPLYMPLSDAAVEVLRSLPFDGDWVFKGKKPGMHLGRLDHSWKRVRKQSGLLDVRVHDLRRTVGSWLAQSGESLHLIGKVLNQSTQRTTEVYARFGQDHVRTALVKHTDRLLQFGSPLFR